MLDRILKNKKDYFELISYKVTTECAKGGDTLISEATVKLKVDGKVRHTVFESSGPVGALDGALRQALEQDYPQIKEVKLADFKVRILDSTEGSNARIRVQIESTDGENFWGTVGASDNIIEASWEALKDAVEYKLHFADL